MLRTGLALFDLDVDHVVNDVGCGCANYPVTEDKVHGRYDFGPRKCRECANGCSVNELLIQEHLLLNDLIVRLNELPTFSKQKADGEPTEIGQILAFLLRALREGCDATSMDSCLTVGDPLIALESSGRFPSSTR